MISQDVMRCTRPKTGRQIGQLTPSTIAVGEAMAFSVAPFNEVLKRMAKAQPEKRRRTFTWSRPIKRNVNYVDA
jgi:hypothetical protein